MKIINTIIAGFLALVLTACAAPSFRADADIPAALPDTSVEDAMLALIADITPKEITSIPFVVVLSYCDDVLYTFVDMNNTITFTKISALKRNTRGSLDRFYQAVEILDMLGRDVIEIKIEEDLGATCV